MSRCDVNISFGSTQLETEIGAILETRRSVLIQSAHFQINLAGAVSLNDNELQGISFRATSTLRNPNLFYLAHQPCTILVLQ